MQAVCVFFPFFSPIFFKYGTRERRLPSKWNSCQEFPMSQCAFSPFVLPDPLPSPNPSRGEKARGRWTKALSPLSSRWDPHRCWVMGPWEGGGPREEVRGEERKNGGLNRGKLPSFLTGSRRERRGGATDYLMMEERGWWWEAYTCGGVFREGSPARKKVTICCSHRRWRREARRAFNPVQKC